MQRVHHVVNAWKEKLNASTARVAKQLGTEHARWEDGAVIPTVQTSYLVMVHLAVSAKMEPANATVVPKYNIVLTDYIMNPLHVLLHTAPVDATMGQVPVHIHHVILIILYITIIVFLRYITVRITEQDIVLTEDVAHHVIQEIIMFRVELN